ncbi:flagellar biosynthetic protein FliR [Roseovarius sp. D22-M7]|uniref:flagellar biosynthetic protein FliR n=1 Tax=Roseovarius sp. D22-M7 TaxID=3127116 RepID=UPI0030102A23
MTALMEGLEITQDLLWLHFTVFLRVAPIIALFPGFGENSVPTRIKLGLALAMTAIVTPAVAPHLMSSGGMTAPLPGLVLTESGVGLLLGIGIRLFVLALQTAGSIAAQSTSLAQFLGGASTTPIPAMGHILVIGAVALAMILDLHVRLAEMAVLSYRVFPVSEGLSAPDVAQWGIARVAHAFGFAFTLSAPFVIASMVYNLTLGIINRAMPQLMVVFVGAPAITAAGLALLMLLAPTMLKLWVEALHGFLANPLGDG